MTALRLVDGEYVAMVETPGRRLRGLRGARVEDPAVEGALWMYRIREENGWVLEVFLPDGQWQFGGRFESRGHAEAHMLSGASESVNHWRCGLARVFHVDYKLVAVDRNESRTVITEQVRRHFWHVRGTGYNAAIDGYVA